MAQTPENDRGSRNSAIVQVLTISGTVIGFLLIILSRFLVDSFWRDLIFGIGLALAPSGVIGLIGDYLIFGRTLESLRESDAELGHQVEALRTSTDFLKRSSNLGLEMIYSNREAALKDFSAIMREESQRKVIRDEERSAVELDAKDVEDIKGGRLIIVGSSVKGLLENIEKAPEIIRDAINSGCKLRILLTHPEYSRYRENQEDRPTGAIEDEIFAGLRTLESCVEAGYPSMPSKKLSEVIRLYKGTPTCFMIVAGDRMLINPYPYEEEAYRSFCVSVRKVDSWIPPTDIERTIYSQYLRAHFEKPWKRNAVPYRHYWLEGPNPNEAWDRKSCYGDIFVVQDAGHFYLAAYLDGQHKAQVRGMPTSIAVNKVGEKEECFELPKRFSVRLFHARDQKWHCLDEQIRLLNIDPERRRGKASGRVEGNLHNDYLMLGLFDPEEKVISPHLHIDSAPEGLKGQPLPLFYVWLRKEEDVVPA